MSELETCLATFAVAAFVNNDSSIAQSHKALVKYLAAVAQDNASQRFALADLESACAALMLDSTVGLVIRYEIAGRIIAIDDIT